MNKAENLGCSTEGQKPAREVANQNMSQPSCNFLPEFFLSVVKLRYKISIVRYTDCKLLYVV